ncbi:MlaD family protein [Pedobacter arcticus]|uniref:MlaD family protein n=1 Tax=Pedobacter arcticus TaxID=752140 RepID=UPI00037009F8|nr:MlaD family protein [Pedobacter arcticus]
MAKTGGNNIKLGLFVFAGLLVLVIAFYMIGNGSNILGRDFELKARFNNLSGLTEGNNVLFSGIQAGTVKKIDMVGDTIIEVTMQIDSKIQPFIKKNAMAAIGTEGLMGNKVINIEPAPQASAKVTDGDMLQSSKLVSTEEMMKTLSKTNDDVAAIAKALKETVLSLDTSELFSLLNDPEISKSLKSSLSEINKTTKNANNMSSGLNTIVEDMKKGKGTAGMFLTDPVLASNLKNAVEDLRLTSGNAKKITAKLSTTVDGLDYDLNNGKGPIPALLRDSNMTQNLNKGLYNLQKGTGGFSDIMEATKHSFLFRRYFKKQEKDKTTTIKK